MSHDPTNPNTNPNTPEQSQLGRASAYADKYDPSLLFPIARTTQREAMGIQAGALPFFGADLWTAFELSWLNPRGKPQVAIAHFTIPCETPNIIESKSFKLYLNEPARGGGTTFPDVGFEVAPVRGNAVFFSYDRPHPSTRTLHAGAPVLEGEKWVATKWLREGRFE